MPQLGHNLSVKFSDIVNLNEARHSTMKIQSSEDWTVLYTRYQSEVFKDVRRRKAVSLVQLKPSAVKTTQSDRQDEVTLLWHNLQ